MVIRDKDTNEPVDWSHIFFSLHHYCNLNKWEIWEYTLPQITELMKSTSKHIQFEVETRMTPFGLFGSGGGGGGDSETSEDGDYEVATEEDIMSLAKVLGGGI